MIQSYQVHMDLEGFRELFVAQQRNYVKKVGILCTVMFVPGSLFSVYMLVSEPSFEALGFLAMCVALSALGIADLVKPPAMLSTRKRLVYTWFYTHGVPDPDKVEFKRLATDYTVSLGAYGFAEQSATFALNTPWFSLREKPVKDTRGTYFVVDDGKESSALYNMIGINWALREETAVGALFIPASVTAANPGLVDEISRLVASMRAEVKGRSMSPEKAKAIQAWAGATPTDVSGR